MAVPSEYFNRKDDIGPNPGLTHVFEQVALMAVKESGEYF